jgi:hypothetical protein
MLVRKAHHKQRSRKMIEPGTPSELFTGLIMDEMEKEGE